MAKAAKDFPEIASYWSREPKDGEKPPTSDEVVTAIVNRARAHHCIGQAQSVVNICQKAALSSDQINTVVLELNNGSKTTKMNIRSEYLQIIAALNALLSAPPVIAEDVQTT